jgi:hypothetical protein
MLHIYSYTIKNGIVLICFYSHFLIFLQITPMPLKKYEWFFLIKQSSFCKSVENQICPCIFCYDNNILFAASNLATTATYFRCVSLSFLVILEFELRAWHWLGRHSTAWATPPALSVLVVLEIGPHFLHGPAWTMILLFTFPTVAGMTCMCQHALLFLLRWGGLMSLFAQAGFDLRSSQSQPPG